MRTGTIRELVVLLALLMSGVAAEATVVVPVPDPLLIDSAAAG